MDLEEIESLYEQDKESAQHSWEKGVEQNKNRKELELIYNEQLRRIRKKYYVRMSRFIEKNKNPPKKKKEEPKKEEGLEKKKKSKFIEKLKEKLEGISFWYNIKKSSIKFRIIGPNLIYLIAKIKYLRKRTYKFIRGVIGNIIEQIIKIIKTVFSKVFSLTEKIYHKLVSTIKRIILEMRIGMAFISRKLKAIKLIFFKEKPKKEEPKK